MDTSRRHLLAMAGAATAAIPLLSCADAAVADQEVLRLWPKGPPDRLAAPLAEKFADQSHDPAHPDRFVTGVAEPRLIIFRPARPNGAAVLLMPGGGYGFLSYDNEGVTQARWLNAIGVTAFVLLYRLPSEGWADRADVPLKDAQRAMRLIRANAGRYAIDTRRVSVIGFSAGGHLAGSLATRHAEPVYAPVDAADAQSARPDLVGLIYPVVSLSAPFTHGGSRDALLGADAPEAERARYSVELRVDAQTPPCFLVHAGDDGLVPVMNSISLYTALQTKQRPAELHIFAEGGHGFGVRPGPDKPASAWPRLFPAFAASQNALPRV
ncbi:alpha/beta hydrolase [uncultured Sphingomonas sp.]|uniref:alpha/beta hydrolase n=1 Tax=uncultured Sphingomonas sp. TaxID=158754 RepID=UPI002630CC9A|nr:alpha/beta hydrolase [uncultured Sphingomonas sp.]